MKTYEKETFADYYKRFLESKCNESRYIDPDTTYRIIKEGSYYYDLKEFLVGRFAANPNYQIVTSLTKMGIEINYQGTKLLLRSDQLGFSAQEKIFTKKINMSYPLVGYLNKSKHKPEAIDDIVQYILSTRTIGGSFLWPVIKDGNRMRSLYNNYRGANSYVEDRVDLTLMEIKHVYEFLQGQDNDEKKVVRQHNDEYPDDLILKYNDKFKIVEWLEIFGSFDEFIEFFIFDPFVEKKEKNGRLEFFPIDIIQSKLKENRIVTVDANINKIKKSISSLYAEELKQMMDNVQYMIEIRSKKMEN